MTVMALWPRSVTYHDKKVNFMSYQSVRCYKSTGRYVPRDGASAQLLVPVGGGA